MSQFWSALQQSIWIAYGNVILWVLALAIALSILLATGGVLGIIFRKYIK